MIDENKNVFFGGKHKRNFLRVVVLCSLALAILFMFLFGIILGGATR